MSAKPDFSNLSDMLQNMLQGASEAAKVKAPTQPWWATYSYPELQEFDPGQLMTFPTLALFFRALGNGPPVYDRKLTGPNPPDDFFEGLMRLGGSLIYDKIAEGHHKFISFTSGAVMTNLTVDKLFIINLVGNKDLVDKISFYCTGYSIE